MSDESRGQQHERDRFGDDVAAAIRARDLVSEAEYQPDDFTVRYRRIGDTEQATCHLQSAFRAFGSAPDPERCDRIAQFASLADHGGAPEDFETARPLLRPVIRTADYDLRFGDPRQAIRRPFVPYLVECVVIDSPTAMAYVNQLLLDTWGVSAEEVFAMARENLAATALDLMGLPMPPLRGSMAAILDDGDHYTSSLPLIPGWLAGLGRKLGGQPLVFLADHASMFVAAGIDDEDVLGKMVDAVGRHYAQAVRPISPVPLTVDEDGAVVPFTVGGEHRAAAALNQARIALAMNVYGGQAEGMREGGPEDSDTYLAELIAVAIPEGSESTVAALGQSFTEVTLLPQADLIGVLREDAAELLLVPFGMASQILGLTAVDGYDPPRYRLGHGLNADIMADLRRHAVALPAPKP